jgi:hypothetical protein
MRTLSVALLLSAFLIGCGDSQIINLAGDTTIDAGTDAASEGDAADVSQTDATTDQTNVNFCGCFETDGTYCSATAQNLADDVGCTLPVTEAGLLRCSEGIWTLESTCDNECQSGETAGSDVCSLAVCDCFVQVSWCGSGAQKHAAAFDEPCRVPLLPDHDGDILACNGDTWIVKEPCEQGCFEAPTGTPDYCVGTRTSQNPGWDVCADKPLLKSGLHPEASNRLRCAGVGASEISQTVGYAAASAGYHAPDGTANGLNYTAAVDIRIGGMNEAQIKTRLNSLALNGFAAWYRKPGSDGWPSSGAPHIHAVFTGVKMKSQLRGQVRDWLNGRNGLSSHTIYRFWTPTAAMKDIIKLLFERNYTP